MRPALKVFVALALTMCAALAHADPPGRVGRLNYVSGALSFAPGEAPDQWAQAVLNRPLTGGDRLWADGDGRGELHVGSTAVRLAPLTSLDILNLDDQRIQLRLAQGTLNLRVRELDADDFVEVATPAGAILVREPGSYRVGVDPSSDVTRVTVHVGEVEVVTPAQTFLVPPGQAAVVSQSAPPSFEVAGYLSDEFDAWSAERDRREDQVASTRYVSPHMTGYEDLDHYGSWRTLPEYGAVWVPARVAPGWAPYRYGHWTWISPWGWTWVDDAPWGFAPFHYGRWVWVHNHWAWAPGRLVRRPIYAPALVAFVGGSHWSLSIGTGPAVGWFPLGWREPFHPWYRASHAHVRNVNVTHVTNVTNIHNITHVHRHRPEAVTVVPQQSFVSARPVGRSRFRVAQADLARAELIRERPPADPVRASIAPERPGQRPPALARTREVVAVTPPAQGTRELPGFRDRTPGTVRITEGEPRVRVLDSERFGARRRERAEQSDSRIDRSPPPAIPQPSSAPAAAAGSGAAAAAVSGAAPGAGAALEQRPGFGRRERIQSAPSTAPPIPGAPATVNAPRTGSPQVSPTQPAPSGERVGGESQRRPAAGSESRRDRAGPQQREQLPPRPRSSAAPQRDFAARQESIERRRDLPPRRSEAPAIVRPQAAPSTIRQPSIAPLRPSQAAPPAPPRAQSAPAMRSDDGARGPRSRQPQADGGGRR